MKSRSLLALFLALCLLLGLCPACTGSPVIGAASPAPSATPSPEPTPVPTEPPKPGFHTLHLASESAPLCWNAHTWESETDAFLLSLTASPLMDLGLTFADGGEVPGWLYTMADSVEDITAEWEGAADWGIGAEESGRVWRIRLNESACWSDDAHTPITADDYIYSMRQLISPEMSNYRAESFCTGSAAILHADAYRHAGSDSWAENAVPGGAITYPYAEWVFTDDGCRAGDGSALYFSLYSPITVWMDGCSLEDYRQAGYFPEDVFAALLSEADADGYVAVTRETADLLYSFTGSDEWGRESRDDLAYYVSYRQTWPAASWDSVGLLKEGAYSLLYITESPVSEFDILFALTTPWLVYEPLYEAGKFEYGGRVYTNYGTLPETSMSCGPYRLTDAEGGTLTLERSEGWFGYAADPGHETYETDRIILHTAGRALARQMFAAGKLDVFIPAKGQPLPEVPDATVLLRDDGYVYRFFMVTDRAALLALQEADSDESKTVNKTCLANDAFREALSCAIDRARMAEAQGACQPALGLFSDVYLYDAENDPASVYRASVPGMTAVCDACGLSLSDVTEAEALRAACDGCTGYNPTRARHLFQLAFDQMAESGDWIDGMTIELRCAVGSGELTEAQLRQNELMQQFLDEATVGTELEGRCTITFCCMDDRYDAVARGGIEMGYGAWGGAAFDPYGLLQCYCDPAFNPIQEGCGFDPAARLLTLIHGEKAVTRTYTEWCRSLLDGGDCASDPALRLEVLAGLEEALLKERRMIVVASGGEPVLLSAKLRAGSDTYSILCGFGGIRSLRYAYDDAEWAAR